MSIQKPLKISNINLNNITYTKMKVSKKRNSKIIYIKYRENNKLKNFVFQTPRLLSIFESFKINGYDEIDIPLKSDNNEKEKLFIDFLNQMDDKIKYDANINSSVWFDNFTNNDVKIKKIINENDDIENGVISLKILKTPEFETIISLDNKKCFINNIPIDCWCKMILEFYAIIINDNSTINLFVRPIIMSFKTKKIENYNYDFIESDEDKDEEETIFIKKSDLLEKYNNDEVKKNNENLKHDNINSTTSSD